MSKIYTSNSPERQSNEAGETNKLSHHESFVRRMLVASSIVATIVLLILFIWAAAQVLLIIFGGILLAVLLRALSDILSKYTGFPIGWSLTVVVLGLVASLGVGGWRLAPRVTEQVAEFTEVVPLAIDQFEQRIREYTWADELLDQWPGASDLIDRDLLVTVTGFFPATLGVIVETVVIFLLGLYFAARPELYLEGIIRLMPINKRPRACEVLDMLGYALRWWLLGRLFAMTCVGVASAVGLWLLDVPLAMMFGILTFALTFVPYLGPIVSAILPALVALMHDPMLALYVVLLYLVIQNVEGYVLTPLILRATVLMPPALTIIAEVLFGVLFGVLGIVLATPFIAVAMVLVKMLYIQDVLGDPIEVMRKPGEQEEALEKRAKEHKEDQSDSDAPPPDTQSRVPGVNKSA